MTVSKRTRYEVLKRDNFTCRYCRETEGKIVVDHVIPVTLGGSDDPDNLVAACHDCNAGKASTSPTEPMVADVKNSDARWAKAIIMAAEIRASEQNHVDEYVDLFATRWAPRYKPNNYRSTLESLYRAGLPEDRMLEAITVAFAVPNVESRFRYFCGVSWRMVRELQEIAKSLLEADEEDTSAAH